MAEIAKKHLERIKELKSNVDKAHLYFEENIKRFNEFTRFVYKSTMTQNEVTTLASISKPTIEFNVVESYVSRLLGEFVKQQPSLKVSASDDLPADLLDGEIVKQIEVTEAYLRSMFFEGSNDMLLYNTYKNVLSGGYSVLKVYTDYLNEMSFEQNIYIDQPFDVTMCLFDPLARDSHKGDGKFCCELFPMTKETFALKYGQEKADNLKYSRSLAGLDWTYKDGGEDIVLVCCYYEKKIKKETIVKLSNGKVMPKKEYSKFVEWYVNEFKTEQPPIIIKERKTDIQTICCYHFNEAEVLEYYETDYKFLPLIFVDGNSAIVKDGSSSCQVTRPYIYNAKGIQQLKNFAGQSLANELENLVQHKFIVALESIPIDYEEAYQNVQKADTLIYNNFLDANNPNIVLPPPREVNRTPIPPEIAGTFRMSDEMTQMILGSYDPAQGVTNAAMSGIAFARSAIQSNASSLPYIVGFIKGLNRVAEIVLDLIPKFYKTPRSLPVLLPNGKRDYEIINQRGSIFMNYDPKNLQVKVDVGVNFAMQKEISLQTIIQLSQASKSFGDFINQYGLETLLDNIDIRGIEDLKVKASKYMQELAQNQAKQGQMAEMQMQLDTMMKQIEIEKSKRDLNTPSLLEIQHAALEEKAQYDAANLELKEREAQAKLIETMTKIQAEGVNQQIQAAKVDAEQTRTQIEAAISIANHLGQKQESEDEREE